MRLDKIYTKVGDKGKSQLATGQRVSKSSLRLEAYGTVDELNSHTGLIRDYWQPYQQEHSGVNVSEQLLTVQHELFDTGAELASLNKSPGAFIEILQDERATSRLESDIDRMNTELAPLENFVLPGGHILNSQLHIARCICRRAERAVIRLHESEDVRPGLKIYLNRLSDWFFVLSRYVSLKLDCPEVQWQQPKSSRKKN